MASHRGLPRLRDHLRDIPKPPTPQRITSPKRDNFHRLPTATQDKANGAGLQLPIPGGQLIGQCQLLDPVQQLPPLDPVRPLAPWFPADNRFTAPRPPVPFPPWPANSGPPFQPLGPNSYQPLRPPSQDGYQLSRPPHPPFRPPGLDGYQPLRPSGQEGYQPFRPQGPDGYQPFRPLGMDAFQSFWSPTRDRPEPPRPPGPGPGQAHPFWPQDLKRHQSMGNHYLEEVVWRWK